MFESIILAITQGITEFLPVSSSGHIAILSEFLDVESSVFLVIWLHVSSLLAVLVYYYKDIRSLIVDFFKMSFKIENKQGPLVLKLLGATAITGVMGLFAAEAFIDYVTMDAIGLMLIATAGMIYLAERVRPITKGARFTWMHAAGVGAAQGLAVLPGLSRSGTTIAYLVGAGIERTHAVRLSMLLSIPTILGALVFGLSDANNLELIFTTQFIVLFVVGFLASLLSIKLMNIWVAKHWKLFIPYCLILGLIVLFI